MLTIKHIIVHYLHKEPHSPNINLELSGSTLPTDSSSQKLIEELNGRYISRNRSKITYARFGAGSIFQQAFDTFLPNGSEASFIAFTKEAILDLKKRISSVSAARGGYVVFAQFESAYNFTGVYIIREKKGVLFKKDQTGSFKINDALHIDFEKIAMACRVNSDIYNSKPELRYLSFIDSRKEEVSKFFNDWISSDDTVDNVTDTKNLYKLLHNLDLPLDEDSNQISREDMLNKAYRFIKDQPGRLVDINQLSHALYNDPEYITTYLSDNYLEINSQFKADLKVLSRFATVKVSADNISLSFPAKALQDIVTISEANPDIITIRSAALAQKIREENQPPQG